MTTHTMNATFQTATTCLILAGWLGTAGAQDRVGRHADIGESAPAGHKPAPEVRELADVEITEEATQSILKNMEAATTLEKLQAAISLTSLEEAGKYLDRASMETIDEWIYFEKEKIVVFAWQGSGQDSLRADPSGSNKEQTEFSYTPGLTKDLKTHVKICALPKDTRWTVSTTQHIRIKCGNGVDGRVELNLEGAVGVQGEIDLKINGQPMPLQPQAPEK